MFRRSLINVLKSAENALANESKFTPNNIWTVARYYIPLMPTPTKEFDIDEYERRVKKTVERSQIPFSDNEKKQIINEIVDLRDSMYPSSKVKLYRTVADLDSDYRPSNLHIITGTIFRPILVGILLAIGSNDPGSLIIPVIGFGAIYSGVKLNMFIESSIGDYIGIRTSNIFKILNGNRVNNKLRLERDFGLIDSKQISAENWERLRYWEKQNDEDAVVIFPKNTYDNGKE